MSKIYRCDICEKEVFWVVHIEGKGDLCGVCYQCWMENAN